jgi:hypothetical protein
MDQADFMWPGNIQQSMFSLRFDVLWERYLMFPYGRTEKPLKQKAMKRRNFILATVATLPLVACSKIKEKEKSSLDKGFKVNNGEARFGEHYKMEAFFKLTNEWKSPPLPAEVNKAFEDHGMKIVGKPLTRE